MIYHGDCLEILEKMPRQSVDCIVTSPPYYGLRDYGVAGQLGIEETPEQYINNLGDIFFECKRVLKDQGTIWINIGDTYYGGGNNRGSRSDLLGSKQASNRGAQGQVSNLKSRKKHDILKSKDLIGIPWRLAFHLQESGFYLRQDIIWAKPNPMPESVTDRFTKSHEHIFLLSKNKDYYFDQESIREPFATENKGKSRERGITPLTQMKKDRSNSGGFEKRHSGRNKRDVWFVKPKPFKGAHFATFPPDLIEPCILAGCPKDGVVLDPFFGSGTVGLVAKKHGRNYIGIELNEEYIKLAEKRIAEFSL